MERNGERSQSTISISAAEPISVNGMTDTFRLERRIGTYGLFELSETAPAIRSMSIVLSTKPATVTAITVAVSSPFVSGATERPAAAAATAKTAELNATRIGGPGP